MAPEPKFEVIPVSEVPLEVDSEYETEVPLVLVVDDEKLVADTLAAVLMSSGLSVLKAYNGESALQIALDRTPSLLLSDVMMPGMNGVQLAISVASALPACAVMLFSGHASIRDLADAQESGFDFPLMSKPMHPVELLKRVYDRLSWQPQPKQTVRSTRNHALSQIAIPQMGSIFPVVTGG